jgi:aspartate kinase
MATADSIKKVGDIVLADKNRKLVVVSAPGAVNGQPKITDLLIDASKDIGHLNEVKARYESIVFGLKIDFDLDAEFKIIEQDYWISGTDYLISRGEYLIAKIFAKFMSMEFFDSKHLIMLNSKGKVDLKATARQCKKNLNFSNSYIVPGFYGAYNNQIVTLGRGGSDISGAIFSYAVGATLYENWTDVDGFFVQDPNFVKCKCNKKMSYSQALSLTLDGVTVLHSDSLAIASLDNIPISIKNTFDNAKQGTSIVDNYNSPKGKIVGVVIHKDYILCEVTKVCSSFEFNLGLVVNQFIKHHLPIKQLYFENNQFCLLLERSPKSTKLLSKIKKFLKEKDQNIKIKIKNVALMKVVGNHIQKKVFKQLQAHKLDAVFMGITKGQLTLAMSDDDSIKLLTNYLT